MPIAVDVENPPKQKIDYEYGKHSLTRFRVVREGSVQWEIAKFHFSCVHVDADTTLLELNPETGRYDICYFRYLKQGFRSLWL